MSHELQLLVRRAKAIVWLDEHKEFKLTGSRYFGNPTEGSDWDFFGPYSEENLHQLILLGFRRDGGNYRTDTEISTVLNLGDIHVQLVADVEKKEKAQKLLFNTGALQKVEDKVARKVMWDLAYAAV